MDTQNQNPADNQINGEDLDLPVDNPNEFSILVQFPDASAPQSDVGPTARGTARESGGTTRSAQQIEERSKGAIQAAMNTIQEMAKETDLMRKGIPGGSQPRMVKIKFGVQLDFQVGAFLAKASSGATMEVELEWARRSDDVLRVLRAETDVDGALFTNADAEG